MKTNPNFLLAQNQIYHLNCSQLLALLRQNEMLVDAIITDPPYNISKKDNFFTSIGRAGRDHGS
jgi:DNA modification methylase